MTPSPNGTWQGSGDTTDCANGATTLNDTVSVTDPLGNAQAPGATPTRLR